MPTELQQRHAKRIEQYAPLEHLLRSMLKQAGVRADDQFVEITLVWARIGRNIKYLRFHYLLDGLGDPKDPSKPHQLVIQGDQVTNWAHELTRLMGGYTWNASGMSLFREGVD